MQLRPASTDDMAAITEIYAAVVAASPASYEFAAPDMPEMTARFEALVAQGYPYLVAQEDGEIAGFAYASRFRGRDGYDWAVEDTVYIAEPHRGKGVGRALLTALIDACTQKGYRHMLAAIGDASYSASLKLHEAVGFREIGTIPGLGWKEGKWHDWVLMHRQLGAGAQTPPDEIG